MSQEEAVATSSGENPGEAKQPETAENSLRKELDAAKKEIESLKDSWTRERAEFQNYKRRTAQEFSNIKREAVKSLVASFLTPIDNLDRVRSGVNVTEELKPFVEGVEMILKEFYSVLEKSNVFRHAPQGEPFDPTLMEALSSEEGDQYSEETVIEVYQAGFYIKDNEDKFSLRPARVRIGKPKA
ncbi:nucleotide exchange factor GrpE [Leptospira langatensis]|uniref:Protein GrpE n=2 Tax=Leptospira langatensis TaxID=2484983 RepID=A0A5F1ZX37_9LEPT|nr:nucleotide exchange factor GrpE [Leptospira langatensis]TGK01403.1 nucleotide exchange factor GrpE [Leptospira langatensis]TGL42147.1 nucleotide exchange factor GrpE [Leptospira langatensis]